MADRNILLLLSQFLTESRTWSARRQQKRLDSIHICIVALKRKQARRGKQLMLLVIALFAQSASASLHRCVWSVPRWVSSEL